MKRIKNIFRDYWNDCGGFINGAVLVMLGYYFGYGSCEVGAPLEYSRVVFAVYCLLALLWWALGKIANLVIALWQNRKATSLVVSVNPRLNKNNKMKERSNPMKVTLVGKQEVSYTQKSTGNVKEGMSLFYTAPKDGVNGLICDSFWIRKDSQFYNELKKLDLSKPLAANVVNEVLPGGRFPEITAIDIIRQ